MHKIPFYQSASQHEHVGCITRDSLDSHGIYMAANFVRPHKPHW
jgi:hypothetical protein